MLDSVDVNEIMHTVTESVRCCFTKCKAWFPVIFCFLLPTMIKGLATTYELASVKQSDLTGSQTFSNALREGFFLFLWNYYFCVCLSYQVSIVQHVSYQCHHVLNVNTTL